MGIGLGVLIAIVSEPLLRRLTLMLHRSSTPTPESTVAIIIIGAILVPVGQFIFAFTSAPPTPWIWPFLAGIPFGAGNCLVFIYTTNYLAGLYGLYAASALAGNTVLRNLVGGVLPLVGPAMYSKLGARNGGAVLAVLEAFLVAVPTVFYFFGDRIRKRSHFIKNMGETGK